jgi:hypothetical protein
MVCHIVRLAALLLILAFAACSQNSPGVPLEPNSDLNNHAPEQGGPDPYGPGGPPPLPVPPNGL